jgi:hypothetical protein
MTTPPAATSTGPAPKFDAFLSYKHGNPDESVARDLLRRLEADGYKVAIDKRDFVSQATVVDEMERCIRESGFTIAIVSGRYLKSGFTDEETVIQRTRPGRAQTPPHSLDHRKGRNADLDVRHVRDRHDGSRPADRPL